MTTYRIAFADQRTTPPKLIKVDVGAGPGARAETIAHHAIDMALRAATPPLPWVSLYTTGPLRTVPSHCRVLP